MQHHVLLNDLTFKQFGSYGSPFRRTELHKVQEADSHIGYTDLAAPAPFALAVAAAIVVPTD
jgi:hypothetical protein